MGTGILLVGEGGNQHDLANHLSTAGYAVACTSPAEVVGVLRSIWPAEIMIMPDVPPWLKAQICSTLSVRHPEIRVVLLRHRSLAPESHH